MCPPVTSSLVAPMPNVLYPSVPHHHTPPPRLPHIHGCRHCVGWLQQHLPLVWSSDLPAKTSREIIYWPGADTGKRRQHGWAWRGETGREEINVGSIFSSIQVLVSPPSHTFSTPHPHTHTPLECTLYSQVGLVQYGESSVHEWSLGDFRTKEEVVRAARNLSRREGRETKTAQAIMMAWWGTGKGGVGSQKG